MSAGQILGTTGQVAQETFLEVKEAFDRVNVFLAEVESKTIESGSSAQFVITGKDTSAKAKTQARSGGDTAIGSDIDVNTVGIDERIITIDDLVYDARRIDGKEEKIAHYDVRGPITNMIGTVLANYIDEKIVGKLGDCVGAAGLVGNPNGAAAVTADLSMATGAAAKGNVLAEGIFEAVATLKQNDVYADAVVAVDPIKYSYLAQSDLVNKDMVSSNGGLDTGIVLSVAGAKIITSNTVTDANTGLTGGHAIVFTSEAVGVVNLIGLQTESNYDFNKFATLVSGRFVLGMGVLRPECAVAIIEA